MATVETCAPRVQDSPGRKTGAPDGGLWLPKLRLPGVLLAFLALGAVALFSILAATGMSLDAGFAKFVLLAFLLLAIAGYCHFRGHDWRLTDSATASAFVTISLLLCGLVSLTGLRLGLPLADPLLADSDRLVSTIPMGGHYVTDLGGGIVVWTMSCLIAAWACGFRPRGRACRTAWLIALCFSQAKRCETSPILRFVRKCSVGEGLQWRWLSP